MPESLGKDMLEQEIYDGDLIIKIDMHRFKLPGIVKGGITKGGKIRFIDCYGCKENTHTHNCIKATKKQVEAVVEKLVGNNTGQPWWTEEHKMKYQDFLEMLKEKE